MSARRPEVVPASPDDLGWMVEAATAAFADDPLWRYLVPDRRARAAALKGWHARVLRRQVDLGFVYAVGRLGWASWLPPSAAHSEPVTAAAAAYTVRCFGVAGALRG
jgi:hypothetical protein